MRSALLIFLCVHLTSALLAACEPQGTQVATMKRNSNDPDKEATAAPGAIQPQLPGGDLPIPEGCGDQNRCVAGAIMVDLDGDGPAGETAVAGARVAIEGHEAIATQTNAAGSFALQLDLNVAALLFRLEEQAAATGDISKLPFNIVATYEQDGTKYAKRIENLVFAGGRVLDVGNLTLSETGAIKGKVILADGASPLGTDVYIPGLSFIAKAAEDGSFLILYVPEGEYSLMVDKAGYYYESVAGVRVVSKKIAQLRPVTLASKDETPPDTSIASGPMSLNNNSFATLVFSSSEAASTFECKLDNEAWRECRSPYSVTELNEGNHAIQIVAIDSSGNRDPSPASFSWQTDLTPPMISVDTKPNAITSLTTADFALSASETVTYHCSLDEASTPCDATFSLTSLSSGSHTLEVYALDNAGNRSLTRFASWLVDTTVVDTVAFQTPAAITNQSTATILFQANKSASFSCRIDSNTWNSCTSPLTLTALADGLHEVQVRATDLGGSVETTPLVIAWRVDGTPPDAPTLTPVAGALTNSSTPTLSWSAGPADTAHYQMEVDATSSFNSPLLRSFNHVTATSASVVPALNDGVWYFRARTFDNAGNSSSWSTALSFAVDTVPPGIPVSDYIPDPISETRPTFSWSVALDAARYRIQVASNSTFTTLLTDSSSVTSLSFQPASPYPPGAVFWRVAAVDTAGNQSPYSLVRSFTIDTTAPGTPTLTAHASPTIDTTPTLTWSAVAGAAHYHIQIATDAQFSGLVVNNGSNVPTSHTPSALADNVYFWRVAAIDGAGNRSGYTAPSTFVVDTTAPSAPNLNTYTPSPTNDLTPTLTWQNPGGGAVSYDIEVYLGASLEASGTGISTTQFTPSSPLAIGSFTWKVRARDAAGNIGAWSSPSALTTTSAASWRYKFAADRWPQPLTPYKMSHSTQSGLMIYQYAGTSWKSSVFYQNSWTTPTEVCPIDDIEKTARGETTAGVPIAACHYQDGANYKIGIYQYNNATRSWNALSFFLTSSTATPWSVTADASNVHLLFWDPFAGLMYKAYDIGSTTWGSSEILQTNTFGALGIGGSAGGTDWVPMMALNGAEVGVFYYSYQSYDWIWKERSGGAWPLRAHVTYVPGGGDSTKKLAGSEGFLYNGGVATIRRAPYWPTGYRDLVWDGSAFVEVVNNSPSLGVGGAGNAGDWDTSLYISTGAGNTAYPIEDDDGVVLTQQYTPSISAQTQARQLIANNAYGNPSVMILNQSPYRQELATAFSLTTMDVGANVGQYSSLGFTSAGDGRIAYYDAALRKLKLASKITGSWTVSTIDSGTDMGSYASLAVKSNDKSVIAYYDGSAGRLKLATEGAVTWSTEVVDSSADVGKYASLALKSNQHPAIAYYNATSGDLKYADFDGSSWTISTVDSVGDVGQFASLAFDGSDHPHISYYDATGENLMYATHDGTSWSTAVVSSGGNVGKHSSIALSGNLPRISSYDASNGDLKYSVFNGSVWSEETVASTGDVGKWTALTVDGSGRSHLTAYDVTNKNLIYCLRDPAWLCRTVDGDETPTQDKGAYSSLKMNPVTGAPTASYFDGVEGGVSLMEGLVLN